MDFYIVTTNLNRIMEWLDIFMLVGLLIVAYFLIQFLSNPLSSVFGSGQQGNKNMFMDSLFALVGGVVGYKVAKSWFGRAAPSEEGGEAATEGGGEAATEGEGDSLESLIGEDGIEAVAENPEVIADVL